MGSSARPVDARELPALATGTGNVSWTGEQTEGGCPSSLRTTPALTLMAQELHALHLRTTYACMCSCCLNGDPVCRCCQCQHQPAPSPAIPRPATWITFWNWWQCCCPPRTPCVGSQILPIRPTRPVHRRPVYSPPAIGWCRPHSTKAARERCLQPGNPRSSIELHGPGFGHHRPCRCCNQRGCTYVNQRAPRHPVACCYKCACFHVHGPPFSRPVWAGTSTSAGTTTSTDPAENAILGPPPPQP